MARGSRTPDAASSLISRSVSWVSGKGDRGRDRAELLVLIEQPARPHVPPLRAVEQVVEAGAAQGQRFLEQRPQVLGHEQNVVALLPAGGDQRPPHRLRHLIGSVAAEAADAELDVVPQIVGEVLDDADTRRPVTVVDLGQIGPHRALAGVRRIDRIGRGQAAVGLVDEPLGVLLGQQRILRRVIDHEIHHHRDAAFRGHPDELAQLLVRRVAGAVGEQRIKPVVVLHCIEAAGEAGIVDRVQEDPVEAHLHDAIEVILPGDHGPRKQWEKVIDPHTLRHILLLCSD